MLKYLGATTLAAGLVLIAASASAEVSTTSTAAAPATEIEEIVVTAQKRTQSVRDVGITMTVVGADELRRSQVSDVNGMANQIVDVIATYSSNLPAFTMRGVGLTEFASNFDSPIAINVDEIYKSKPYMASVPFYDISHVEALKGPQGTLFGRNTTGGSVNYYTNAPEFNTSAAVNASYDNSQRERIDGYVNGTLSSNIAARGSFYVYEGQSGPYLNLLTDKRWGSPDQLAGRLQLLWRGDDTTVRLTGYVFRDKSQLAPYKSPGIYNSDGSFCSALFTGAIVNNNSACLKWGRYTFNGNPLGLVESSKYTDFATAYPNLANNSAYGGSIRIEHKAGLFTLTSISSFDHFVRNQNEDADDSIYLTAWDTLYSRIDQFSQEVRATAQFDRLHFLLGGYYETDALNNADVYDIQNNPLYALPPTVTGVADAFTQHVRSMAIFTNNEYALTDELSFVMGLRYTSDRTSVDGITYLGGGNPVGVTRATTPVIITDSLNADRTDDNLSFRGGVNWKPSRDELLYASVSRGFRSGGYSIPAAGAITTFKPEQLTAYEIGSKSGLLDRTVDLNTAFFYYDYKNIQQQVVEGTNLIAVTTNVGGDHTYGAELEALWRPIPSLQLRLAGSYLDAHFYGTNAVVSTYDGLIPLNGKTPTDAPRYTGQGAIEKTFALTSDLTLRVSTDFRYIAARYLQPTNQPFDRAPAYWTQNARIGISSDSGRWDVALWGKNVTNARILTGMNDITTFNVEQFGDPVSYGVSASYKF